MRHFVTFLRHGLVVIGTCRFRVKREVELVFPTEFKARF